MSFIIGLFSEVPFILFPSDWIGWLGLFLWLAIIGFYLWYWRGYNKDWGRTEWMILLVLLIFLTVCIISKHILKLLVDYARQSTIRCSSIIPSHPCSKFTETMNGYKLFLLRVFQQIMANKPIQSFLG